MYKTPEGFSCLRWRQALSTCITAYFAGKLIRHTTPGNFPQGLIKFRKNISGNAQMQCQYTALISKQLKQIRIAHIRVVRFIEKLCYSPLILNADDIVLNLFNLFSEIFYYLVYHQTRILLYPVHKLSPESEPAPCKLRNIIIGTICKCHNPVQNLHSIIRNSGFIKLYKLCIPII